MALWLVDNILWVGAGAVVLAVGSKLLIGRMLNRLMAQSADDNTPAP